MSNNPSVSVIIGSLLLSLSGCNSDDANTPPTVSNVTASTTQAQPVSGVLPGGDPDGNAVTFSIDNASLDPAKGSVALDNPATGAFTYTPLATETGSHSISFSASDGTSSSGAATLTIDVSPSATGVWTGQAVSQSTGSSSEIIGIVATDGRASFLVDEAGLMIGSISSTDTAATGTLDAFAAPGTTFSDGSSAGPVALDGLVITGTEFSGTIAGVGDTLDFSLAYDATTFETPPALVDLGTAWTAEIAGGKNLSISFDSQGTLTGSDSDGCAYSGNAALVSPVANVYALDITVSACTQRNGNYIGLASLAKADTNTLYRCLGCEETILFGVANQGYALLGILED